MSEIELKARELLARMEKAKRNERGHWCDARAGVDAACDVLPKIIRALAPQWQPIESAPKDGAFYLATNGKDQRVENCPEGHVAGIWHRIDGDWRGSALGDDSTYWQPLPAPPEVEG